MGSGRQPVYVDTSVILSISRTGVVRARHGRDQRQLGRRFRGGRPQRYANIAIQSVTRIFRLQPILNAILGLLPSSSTDHAVARFDGTGGKLQNSGVTIDDSNNVDVPGNLVVDGDVTLGDTDADDITVNGEFVSSLVANAHVTYNLGEAAKRWGTVYSRKRRFRRRCDAGQFSN